MAVGGEGEGSGDGAMPVEALAERLKVLANAKRLRLLGFLAQPHYLEEIASELGTARQTAQEHVQKLEEEGLVQRVRGRRDHGPVTDYVVVPQRLFALQEEFGRLSALQTDLEKDEQVRAMTVVVPGREANPDGRRVNRLSIVHGLRIGQTVPLVGEGPWLIGRDPHAALALDYDPYASSRHAEVRRSRSGLELADLYSSNGTYVDWERLPRGGAVPVSNGSLLRIGKTLLLLRTG